MAEDNKPAQKSINIWGQDIVYYVSGHGRPVVLLHGWGTDASSLAPVFDHLKKFFSVYSLDLPGFGQSPPPGEVWSVGRYAEAVERFIKELALDRPVLIGHSFGGRLGIILGAKKIPHKIVLIDSAGIRPRRNWKYYSRVYTYKCAKKIFTLPVLRKYRQKALSYWLKSNPSSDYNAAQGVMRQIFVKVVNEDLRHYLPRIEAPALLVWGEKDTATPLADGQLMEKLIPDSGLVVFKDAGHYSYLDRLPQFLRVIDSFLHDEMKAGDSND